MVSDRAEDLPDRRNAAATALSLLLAAVAFIRIWQFFAKLPIAAPFQYDYEEGNILNALLRITQGASPYPDPHALPSVINPYGPLAYYLLVMPVKVFGLAFVYPRAMILGCAIGIALLIAVHLRRATGSLAVAATFGLVFLSIPNIQEWAWLLRVDLLGIAFTTAGIVACSSRLDSRHPGRGRKSESKDLLLPALLFAAALLVKLTLIAAPAACFFALLARRRFRDAATLTAVTFAAFSLVMAVFAVITRGAVLVDVFLTHPDPFSFRVYTQGMTKMLATSWPLVALAVIAIARYLAQRRLSPSVLWLLTATLTSITAGKLGSNENHFLEWNAALCLAAGIGLVELTRMQARTAAIVATAAAVVTTGLVLSRLPGYLDNVNPERGCPQAYEWVRTQAGPNLLTENVGALVLGNKKVWVSNPFVLAQLVERAGWSDEGLVRMVRERRFDAVLTRQEYAGIPDYLAHGTERFSPELLRALNEKYTPEPMFQCKDMNVVYRPKSAAEIQSK